MGNSSKFIKKWQMVFDFTQFWLEGRPGNEYFWISHKISGLLTPLTPMGVYPQWLLKMKSETESSNSSQCDAVRLRGLVDLVDLVLSCGLFFMNLIYIDGFLLHSNCFSVRTIFLAYIIIDRCSLISFCTHNFLCQNILMLTLGSQSLIYSYFP